MSPYKAIYSLKLPNAFFLTLAFFHKTTGFHGLQVPDQSFVVNLGHTFIFIIDKPVSN